ncbi:MAG: DUF3703 domain-containing protein [Pseudomonadota bacterium]
MEYIVGAALASGAGIFTTVAGIECDRFGRRIHPHVRAEIAAAKAAEVSGDPAAGFRHLERAHVLGQSSTAQHVRVHLHMLAWATRHHDAREVIGQILRVIGAAAGTWAGLVPRGNTGGSKVSGFRSMPIPEDLADQIAAARAPAANTH